MSVRELERLPLPEFYEYVGYLTDKGEREQEALEKAKREANGGSGDGKWKRVMQVRGLGLTR